MKILGLSTMGNSAAAITVDGKVIAAIEEERLTRMKNDGGFPFHAIKTCLNSADMNFSDLDEIAVYWQPWRFMNRSIAVLKGAILDPKSLQELIPNYLDKNCPIESTVNVEKMIYLKDTS